MKGKINKTLLDSLEPREKPYDVCDVNLPGFLIQVMPGGTKTFTVRYRLPNGKRRRFKIGSSKKLSVAQARQAAHKALARAEIGEDPSGDKDAERADTLADFLDTRYEPWVLANRKSGAITVRRLRTSFEHLLGKKLANVTPWDIEKWRSKRIKSGGHKAAGNRDLAHLKSAISKAVEWGLIDTNPLARVKLAREDHSANVRFLIEEEEQRLMNALDEREENIKGDRDSANEWRRERKYDELQNLRKVAFADHLKPMVILSLNTGLRRGEVFDLQWSSIDFEQKSIIVRGAIAKSGKTRHVQLNSYALAAMEAWRKQSTGDGLVFPNKAGTRFDNVSKSWHGLMKMAKIEKFRWHDMRHHFASKLVMLGVDLNTVRELLGHSDLKMTLRYAHLAPKVKAEAVEKLVSSAVNVVQFDTAIARR